MKSTFISPNSRLKQTVFYKRAEILRDQDEMFSRNGRIITAVDSTIVRDFISRALEKEDNLTKPQDQLTSSNLGPKLHWASLVSLIKSNYGKSGVNPLLILPGHLKEIEDAWNKSMKSVVAASHDEEGNSATSLSVEIMSALKPIDDSPDYLEVAVSIQDSLRQHFAATRESELFSNLLEETLFDVSSLFEGVFGQELAVALDKELGSPNDLFSKDLENIGQSRALRWASIHGQTYGKLPKPDAHALLSLIIINELLLPHGHKVILITDSPRIHEAANEYKFFLPPSRRGRFVSGADYCVRDLKSTTNQLLHKAEPPSSKRKHYWADFILEAPTPFPVSNSEEFLWHSSPHMIDEFSAKIMKSKDYFQNVTDDVEKRQRAYGEEIAKGASIDLVDRFRRRDVQTAEAAAATWGRSGWQGLLALTKRSVEEEVDSARRAFIRSAVMRLVARHAFESLEDPFKGRFFSCLYLEDHDVYQIACAINELNSKIDAREALVRRLEHATKSEVRSNRIDYLILLGAAALYSDLGYWDQAKLLCDEALLDTSEDSDFRGREANFLLAVSYRMTARSIEDLDRAKTYLDRAQELADLRNEEFQEELFSGIRFEAERHSITAAELAFSVYVSDPPEEVSEIVRDQLDRVLKLVNSKIVCAQTNPRHWSQISLRCTVFSLLLMLQWLGDEDQIGKYNKKIKPLVKDQIAATDTYFGSGKKMRVSIRDGLLLMFAAKVTNTRLKSDGWVGLLKKHIEKDVVSIRRIAAFHPFDSQRFGFLVTYLESSAK